MAAFRTQPTLNPFTQHLKSYNLLVCLLQKSAIYPKAGSEYFICIPQRQELRALPTATGLLWETKAGGAVGGLLRRGAWLGGVLVRRGVVRGGTPP